MLLKAGAVSLGLLVASRVLGLLRESALAATFGTSGLADVAVLMLTLPDWIAGVLASGALSYVLLPAWATQTPAQVAASQRRVTLMLLAAGIALAASLIVLRAAAIPVLAPGLPEAAQGAATQALVWSAGATPAALLAALWATRLQHERDFLGMYAGALLVNMVLIAAILTASAPLANTDAVLRLGIGLLLAAGARLGWLYWRQCPHSPRETDRVGTALPPPAVWLWAVLSASLPLALPFVARSIASRSGEGGLATFNYAWKLVELPLLLAIQLVATLSFPGIARALVATGSVTPSTGRPIRVAFALAFTLGCAAAAGLLAGAPAMARLLFGWGRMEPEALARVADWGGIAAWGLPPQALIAVALTVLAAQRRMRVAVLGYTIALAVLLAVGVQGAVAGADLMMILNFLLAGVAAMSVAAMGNRTRACMPWQVLLAAAAALLLVAFLLPVLPSPRGLIAGLASGAVCALVVLAAAWLAAGELRLAPGHNSSASHD
jgi:putative peptidoglycan lipid II flippase